jgi:lipopolysaccharide transport system permease protein
MNSDLDDGHRPVMPVWRRLPRRRELAHLRDLLRELVARDIKLRYRRSILGVGWSLLNPLAQLSVLMFVFQRVTPLDIPNYPLFAFTGVLAWGWFGTALTAATSSITGNRELIRQPGFPATVLPAVPVLVNLVHFGIAMGLLLVALPLTGTWPNQTLAALPVVIVLQFVVTLSVGYITATLQVWFRDTSYLLGAVLVLGFFMTPVFYRPGALPLAYQALYTFNPMAVLIGAYRDILVDGRWPDFAALATLAVIAAIVFWAGIGVFTRARFRFAEET